MGVTSFLLFFHSLLRYGVVLFMLGALFFAWRGYLLKRPILNGERMVTIIGVVLCHIQLLLGGILYGMRFNAFEKMSGAHARFWKFEHIGTMIIAIALVTIGRALAKKANEESRKQLLIGIFFLIGFVLIMWAIPWPFTALGEGRGYL